MYNDKADRNKECVKCYITLNANNLKQGVFVFIPRLPQSYWNEPDQYLWM